MKEIKVSIIVPVYNVEEYLRECLESAVNQTMEEIEIIIINDGSTDNSLTIINEYKKKYSNIRVINQENRGLSGARNAGLNIASGEYLYFLDSDDFIDENLCDICYNNAVNEDVDLVLFDAKIFYESERLSSISNFDYNRRKILDERVYSGQEFYVLSNKKWAFRSSVCLMFIKNDLLANNDLSFFEGIVHEDELFSTKCVLMSEKVSYFSIPLFNRRVREGSIMSSQKTYRNVEGFLTVATELILFLKSTNLDDLAKNELKKQIANYMLIAKKINLSLSARDTQSYKHFNHIFNKTIRQLGFELYFTSKIKSLLYSCINLFTPPVKALSKKRFK